MFKCFSIASTVTRFQNEIFILTIILLESLESRVGGRLILEQTNFTHSSSADCYFSDRVAHSHREKKAASVKAPCKYQMPANL